VLFILYLYLPDPALHSHETSPIAYYTGAIATTPGPRKKKSRRRRRRRRTRRRGGGRGRI